MEGPSVVIACEELSAFYKAKIGAASGTAKLPFEKIEGTYLKRARSWGKHLILEFPKTTLRIHFLMFGSYRIDDRRADREPKMHLLFGEAPDEESTDEDQTQSIYFYSCAIKELGPDWKKEYDWSVDLMSPKWDAKKAVKALQAKPKEQLGDLLMDQHIFSGLGNIMKNEILFNLRLHPETKAGALTPKQLRALVNECEAYSWQFYEWKNENVLVQNWRIMRKKICPRCSGKVTKKQTGKLLRWSHFCKHCQPKA